MAKALIKIVYKQIIDAASATNDFKKACFHSSYEEFLIKSQAYNLDRKFDTFSELKANDGRANSLHYKTGFAISGYISLLNKQIPQLQNTLGDTILFGTYKFELIESSITNTSMHQFAIYYITDSLTLIDNFGNNLLLAYGDKRTESIIEETFILKLGENTSIHHFQT